MCVRVEKICPYLNLSSSDQNLHPGAGRHKHRVDPAHPGNEQRSTLHLHSGRLGLPLAADRDGLLHGRRVEADDGVGGVLGPHDGAGVRAGQDAPRLLVPEPALHGGGREAGRRLAVSLHVLRGGALLDHRDRHVRRQSGHETGRGLQGSRRRNHETSEHECQVVHFS